MISFQVPAGQYQAFEEKTARYMLEEIRNVKNGSITADGCVDFQLSGNQDGEAEFVNKKVTDEYLSHTDFVRNVIIPASEKISGARQKLMCQVKICVPDKKYVCQA